jgi:two-component system, NtrC family, sensor kinase
MSRFKPLHSSAKPPIRTERRSMGIALRITLLSWLVTMATLVIFVLVTIPQQEKIFLQNLESKANSVAVSLHDAVAGAAVNEDFASVVSDGQTMLEGDADIDFLIVIKNDGYSLVLEQSGWRVEPAAAPFWHDRERKVTGAIEVVPEFNRRVFHYAQPFDYSGIQWGWIHIGLSLKDFDQGVASLFRNTIYIAFGCIVFSLLVSFLYARQIVRPILRLRMIVQKIAGGDFSVRADKGRQDELGNLAESVNVMAEALLRRNRILESVRFAAQQFMRSSHWAGVIDAVLAKVGQAADVSRAYIFENHTDDTGRLYASQRHEWTAEGITPQVSNPDLQDFSFADAGLESWRALLANNDIVSGATCEMTADQRAFLESQDIRSKIAIPIFAEGAWWGFLGLDDCVQDRIWTDAEKDSLRAGADMLGATITRQRIQDALIEAKATLELRVKNRTLELQTQVSAKEQALAELAAAQSSLLEVSRAAGMAEVATGVLHNVGNVLNSVNVSCTLLMDQLRESRVGNVSKVADLMAAPEGGLAHFLSDDPRGRQIPVYLASLAAALQEEQKVMSKETESVHDRIEHIKEIVSMQQSYGRVSGVNETIPAERLMEDALKLNAGALVRHGVTVQRRYEPIPPITVDKHNVLQILLNLINNAKYACRDGTDREKIITLSLCNHGPDRIRMQVADNGIGIPPENMNRIFQHGFTTRKSGHGFGLHSGALAARQLGGSLNVHSDGPGLGATFTLELPCQIGKKA